MFKFQLELRDFEEHVVSSVTFRIHLQCFFKMSQSVKTFDSTINRNRSMLPELPHHTNKTKLRGHRILEAKHVCLSHEPPRRHLLDHAGELAEKLRFY